MGCLFADEVIVISEVIRNLIRRKYGRTEQVHLIYNGVPCPDYTNCPEYFRELGITERNYILGMCRFVPERIFIIWWRLFGGWIKRMSAGVSRRYGF